MFTAYPLSHMRAAYLDVLPALLVGGRVVLAPRFSASRFWGDLAAHDVTVFSLIGTVMRDPVAARARRRGARARRPAHLGRARSRSSRPTSSAASACACCPATASTA